MKKAFHKNILKWTPERIKKLIEDFQEIQNKPRTGIYPRSIPCSGRMAWFLDMIDKRKHPDGLTPKEALDILNPIYANMIGT